jgi:hypothetical protein
VSANDCKCRQDLNVPSDVTLKFKMEQEKVIQVSISFGAVDVAYAMRVRCPQDTQHKFRVVNEVTAILDCFRLVAVYL